MRSDTAGSSRPGGYGTFLIPAAGAAAILVVLPLLLIVALSLSEWTLTQARMPHWAGLANYRRLLADGAFWSSLSTTLILTVESTAIQVVLGVVIALLFNRDWPGMALIRSLFMAPMMIAPLFVGMIWRLMLSDDFGIVRYALQGIGLDAPLWLDDPGWALQTICLVSVWEWTAFVVLFVTAALQALPAEVFEAAAIDGAGPIRVLFAIVLPLLRPALLVVVLFRAIDGFKLFDIVFAMTAGGPGDATTTMAYFVYQQGIVFFDLGYASTLALIMLLLSAAMTLPLLRLGRAA